MKRLLYIILPVFLLSIVNLACRQTIRYSADKQQSLSEANYLTKWADLTIQTLKSSYHNTPTYASRSLGYLGLAMYECVFRADSHFRSLSGQLNQLDSLPMTSEGLSYDWILAMNYAQDTLLKLFYPVDINLSREHYRRIDSLYSSVYTERTELLDESTIKRSEEYGREVAEALYQWSVIDGGHDGFSRNFDSSFQFPKGKGYWIPPTKGQVVSNFPLHPHWGNNRTFIKKNSAIPTPQVLKYSTDTGSAYYKLYAAVYYRNSVLSKEEKEIAAWWSDDPTETYSPPGHSYNLATIAIKQSNISLVEAACAYARVGMAVADAFINCWKTKYKYFNERPSTYVRNNIDSTWTPYWPEPPFPAFPSGHATQGAATALVLTGVFGENFSFVDNTHEGVRRFSSELHFKKRKFHSFWETATESANSRFLGGIHTSQDNEVGLKMGEQVANNINSLIWRS